MANNDPQDILTVQNIDLNCNDIDPEYGYSHSDYFEVRWGKAPFKVAPGETRRFPRYIAEHFANHLATHILQKRGAETGNEFLPGNTQARAEVVSKIITGVDTYFLPQDEVSEGERISAEVDKLNEEKPLDLGEVVNPLVGVNVPHHVPVTEVNESKSKPVAERSIKDLRAECDALGIEYKVTESKDALKEKLLSY